MLQRDSDETKDKQMKKKLWLVESARKKIKCEDVSESDEGGVSRESLSDRWSRDC